MSGHVWTNENAAQGKDIKDFQPSTNDEDNSMRRAQELEILLKDAIFQIVPLIQAADDETLFLKRASKSTSRNGEDASIGFTSLESPLSTVSTSTNLSAKELSSALSTVLPLPGTPSQTSFPQRRQHINDTIKAILKHSVNTSSPGFLDKLYSAPCPPGIVAELILGILNTNVHVFSVSPVLTLIEREVGGRLAQMFGLGTNSPIDGQNEITGSEMSGTDLRTWRRAHPYPGGINTGGGSASNLTSIVVARNALYPDTKTHGNCADGLDLVLFTSQHAHYSIEKAAVACGFGNQAVISVPTDPDTGAMISIELERLIIDAKERGRTPFYVNVTAGTTVLGSFDPADEIAVLARKYNLWMHVDGAWGGSFIFSEKLRREKLKGCELADSIAINPHKMLGVPVTCSFLLARDLKTFQDSNTLKAGYLFHGDDDDSSEDGDEEDSLGCTTPQKKTNGYKKEEEWQPPNDLADMTLQCGRRGDSLKLFLAWQYYGTDGYCRKIENAYCIATQAACLVKQREDFVLVSQNPPPCLQVCFYFSPAGQMAFGDREGQICPKSVKELADLGKRRDRLGRLNSKVTEKVTKALASKSFMIDHAPALEGSEHMGKFFRAVVNIETPIETMKILLGLTQGIGTEIVAGFRRKYST